MCMGTKTITVMDDAYGLLERKKLRGESFSEEIRRLLGGRNRHFMEFAGAWRGISTAGIKSIKARAEKARKSIEFAKAEW